MLYEVNTPEEYLSQLDDDWRKTTLTQLRALIKTKAPELEERIHYKMLGYGVDDDFLFHLNAQKSYVSLYVGDASRINPDGRLLEGLNVGKGCIRFGKRVSVEESRIDEFIDLAVRRWKEGLEFGC